MMPEKKKRFRDTKIGLFLKNKAPEILDKVGDLLPDAGVLGIVKNLIDTSFVLSPEDKALAQEYIKQLYEIEVDDRVSARDREIEIVKAGKNDLMFTLTGIIGLAVFLFVIYTITYRDIPQDNKELFIHLIGVSEGIVISIFGYYFGSSVKKNVI